MRAKRLFFASLIAFISTFSVIAQDIIPVDSIHQLSRAQKFILKYAKKPINVFGDDNSVELPVEIKQLIGDTTNNKLLSSPQWDKAYFIKDNNFAACLIIPLEAKSDAGILNSELQILYDEDESIINRVVLSYFVVKEDSIKERMLVKSNIYGRMLNIIIYNSDNIIAEIKGLNEMAGVVDYFGTHPELRKDKTKEITIPQGLSSGPSISTRLNRLSRATAIDGTYMMEKDRNL